MCLFDPYMRAPVTACSPLTVTFSLLTEYTENSTINVYMYTIFIVLRGGSFMALSVARKKANRKWNEANRDRYWQCPLRFPAADKRVVVARAADLGIPVSVYIRKLVHTDLNRQA